MVNMYHKAVYLVFVGLSITNFAHSLGISGKLDFGDDDSHSSSTIRKLNNNEYKVINIPVQYKTTQTTFGTKNSNDFDKIGVVCTSGGCNNTNINEGSKDTIQADVVVHVQTKIDLDQNKSKAVDDVPDVPVVVGHAGATLDSTIEDVQNHSFSPQTIVVPDYDGLSPSNPFIPPSTITIEPPTINSRIDSSNIGTFYVPPATPPLIPQSQIDTKSQYDIKIKTVPSVTVTMSEGTGNNRHRVKDVKYRGNEIELRIPYFEPSFHNHYFSENPPPQLVWYPKKTSSFNPVEFRNIPKPMWNPSIWNQNNPLFRKYTTSSTNTCSCQNHQNNGGLNWYPNGGNRRSFNADPGSQINDKLAPLNE